MTELQYGLIGLGGLAVAGVLAYNKWQERAHRKLAEQVLKSDHNDVLLAGDTDKAPRMEPRVMEEIPAGAERREPVFAGDAAGEPDLAPPAPAPAVAPGDAEESFESGDSAGYPAEDAPPPPLPASLLDPRLDFIVAMDLVEAIPASQVLRSQKEPLERLSKPVTWVGLNERAGSWEPLLPDGAQSCRRLRIGLQMADRRGPLAEADLTIFVGAIHNLADELLAAADMPSRPPVLDQAMELDRFCAEVDMEIGVNLVSRGVAFSGTKLRALAESAGMVLGADGLFTRHDDDGRRQFSIQNLENTPFSPDAIKTLSTRGVTFLLDVPRVEQGERVFIQMVELAKRFAETLQGVLVDDNRQPLSEAHLDHIKREFVAKPQAMMAQYGLPAGGPQALRLFA